MNWKELRKAFACECTCLQKVQVLCMSCWKKQKDLPRQHVRDWRWQDQAKKEAKDTAFCNGRMLCLFTAVKGKEKAKESANIGTGMWGRWSRKRKEKETRRIWACEGKRIVEKFAEEGSNEQLREEHLEAHGERCKRMVNGQQNGLS